MSTRNKEKKGRSMSFTSLFGLHRKSKRKDSSDKYKSGDKHINTSGDKLIHSSGDKLIHGDNFENQVANNTIIDKKTCINNSDTRERTYSNLNKLQQIPNGSPSIGFKAINKNTKTVVLNHKFQTNFTYGQDESFEIISSKVDIETASKVDIETRRIHTNGSNNKKAGVELSPKIQAKLTGISPQLVVKLNIAGNKFASGDNSDAKTKATQNKEVPGCTSYNDVIERILKTEAKSQSVAKDVHDYSLDDRGKGTKGYNLDNLDVTMTLGLHEFRLFIFYG